MWAKRAVRQPVRPPRPPLVGDNALQWAAVHLIEPYGPFLATLSAGYASIVRALPRRRGIFPKAAGWRRRGHGRARQSRDEPGHLDGHRQPGAAGVDLTGQQRTHGTLGLRQRDAILRSLRTRDRRRHGAQVQLGEPRLQARDHRR